MVKKGRDNSQYLTNVGIFRHFFITFLNKN